MKKLTLLIFLGLGFLLASAQDNGDDDQISTLFSHNRSNGGYGAVSFMYTQIDGKDAFLVGGRGSWIMGHSFAIGLGGCGFINEVNYHDMHNTNVNDNLAGGYGGLYLEPIVAPRFPVHLSFPILVGFGGVSNIVYDDNWDEVIYDDTMTDTYMVFEPSVELEFNMARHVRMAATFGYRFTSNIDLGNTKPDILEGYNAGLVLKFGKF
jgi:hypothetical protein